MKRISSILILGVFALIFSGGYIAYLSWDSNQKGLELKRVEKSISEYESQDLIKKNSEILRAITAKSSVAALTGDILKWSEVISDITETVPKTRTASLLDVMSYSGGKDGSISMSVKTLPAAKDAYADVADFIESFDESELFSEVFVPSISSGTNTDGKEILTFNISTSYLANYDEK